MTEPQTPSTELAEATPPPPKKGTFAYLLIQASSSIEAVIPRHCSAERLMKIARVAWGRSPKLQECTAQSLITCVMEAAELGLDVSGTLGTAYLVPFKNHGKMEATLIIGYRGLIELARRSGMIQSVESRAVFHGEKFSMTHGMNPSLTHEPDIDAKPEKKDFRGCYMVARLKDGGTHVEWMNKAEIDSIRESSKAGQFGPWKDHYIEMAKKTVLRRGFKMLPMSPEMVTAFTHSDDVEFPGEIIDTTATTVEPAQRGNTKIAALKDALAPEPTPEAIGEQVAQLQEKAKDAELPETMAEQNAQEEPNPVLATIRPTPDDKHDTRSTEEEMMESIEDDEQPSTPAPQHTIVDTRFKSLMEKIGERAGYDESTPQVVVEQTTEKWLAMKNWTKTAIKDDALWKIVFAAACRARFRSKVAADSESK